MEDRTSVPRVLVVDDCLDTRETTAYLLRLWGYDVRLASDGRVALEIAATYHPDVVLLDLSMPEMDGCELARQLRGLPGGDRLLLLSISGFGQNAERDRVIEAGCDEHWVKPIDPEQLRRRLASWREEL